MTGPYMTKVEKKKKNFRCEHQHNNFSRKKGQLQDNKLLPWNSHVQKLTWLNMPVRTKSPT